jgi:phosphoribosylformylglycinamidine cyclo-ligase
MTPSYKESGVDIDIADATKKEMARCLKFDDLRILGKSGDFSALFEASFPGIKDPVLVLKSEEPGSKQWLAAEHGRLDSIGHDLINHLVNDIAVMGATPLAVMDTIICGKLQKEMILQLVSSMADACRFNECCLIGGETSEQPGVIPDGKFILSASAVGVVDRNKIIHNSRIRNNDVIIGLRSTGLHTNGYSLVRQLLKEHKELLENNDFMEDLFAVHRSYYNIIKRICNCSGLYGMAHITGGGIRDNLRRILPEYCGAEIDLDLFHHHRIFSTIRNIGHVSDEDMIRTFNLGIGLILVVAPEESDNLIYFIKSCGMETFPKVIGKVVDSTKDITFTELNL